MPAPITPIHPNFRSRSLLLLFIGAAILQFSQAVQAQIPAFPGAEGFGAYATGGRGGDVYTVVNLNSSGAGSLRYGVETAPVQGRTIVFAVSGYIPINYNADTGNQTVRIVQNKVTIAGQTAPGDGIGLKDGRILVTGNNVVLRHLRIRHGKNGGAGDCLNLESSADNSIIDHISLMFSTDENISFFNSTLDNFTMQYSTSSWGMERHNAGGLWDLQDGTCHHTLWAHHRTRNPKARPFNGVLEWINNVTYHWRGEGFIMGDSQTPANWSANVRGCYYLSIADFEFNTDNTPLSKATIASDGLPNFHLYLDNCLHDSNDDGLLNGTDKGYSIVSGLPYDPLEGAAPGAERYAKSATPFAGASGTATVNIDNPLTAYKKVISSAGALRLDVTYPGPLRDELDTLLIESVENQESILVAKDSPRAGDTNEPPSNGEAQLANPPYNISNGGFGTLNSTASLADSDGDGMPEILENTLGWNAAVQDHNTAMANAGGFVTGLTFFPPNTPAGYTRLEEYLHFLAIPHATIARKTADNPSSLSMDLRRYTRGFNKVPVTFTFSNITNGSVALQPDGYTAVFTPTLNYAGRARFDFTVADGDGSTWTQTMGVLVSSVGVPQNLKWKGDGSANQWNTSALNFLNGTNVTAYASGDNVRFDDTGINTPNINLTTTLIPASIEVDATKNYTFGGSGALSGSGPLTKSGSGTLTLSTTNSSFSGNIALGGGALGMDAGASLGTGNLSIRGGATFNLPPSSPAYFYAGIITVPTGQSGTIYSPGLGNGLNGNLISGDSNSVLYISSGVSFAGTTSSQFDSFTGTIHILPGATLRFSPNSSGNTYGSLNPAFAVNGTLQPRNAGNAVRLGKLSGNGTLSGPQSNAGTGNTTYQIGGSNIDSTFNGAISSNTAVAGSLVVLTKVGTGKLTMNGSSTHTGGTTVSNGTLVVNNATGSGTGTGSVAVKSGAALAGSGMISGATTIESGATLSPGNSIGTLTFGGALTLQSGATNVFELGTTSDQVVVAGALSAAGSINVVAAAGFGPGTNTLFTSSGGLTIGALQLGSLPAGYNYALNTAMPGQIKLVVTSNAPPTPPNFGSLSVSGTNLIFSGSNGTPFGNYFVLAATNLIAPLTNWTRVATNQFDVNGAFIFTNAIGAGVSQNFYRLQQ